MTSPLRLAFSRVSIADIERYLKCKLKEAPKHHSTEDIIACVKRAVYNYYPSSEDLSNILDAIDQAVTNKGCLEIYIKGQGVAWFLISGRPVNDRLLLRLQL